MLEISPRMLLEQFEIVDLSVVVDPAYPVVGLTSPSV